LAARGAGFFPNSRRPRVLWVAVEDTAGQLRGLAHAVRDAMLPFVPEPETREFSGHITLARIKDLDRAATAALTGCAEGFAKAEYGSWTAREVVLMRSQLSPKGSTYSKEGTAELRQENT
jgi:RNA 2',3'-cyclic 3'-phosphodiesterase